MAKKLLGEVFVDSGAIWVGDPCYVMGEDASHGIKNWAEFCKTLDDMDYWNSGDDVCEPQGQGIGMRVQTYWGDGSYPVWAETDEKGRVKKITVDFLADDEDGGE